MYGTVARFKVKAGSEEAMERLSDEFARMELPGLVGEYIFRADADSREYWMAVAFESKEAYHGNASSPEQNQRYERMRALLEADPEWHDGEIVFQFPPK